MELIAQDLARLERLRDAFLAERGRSPWRERRDLEVYDATFGRRIAWKWGSVLEELVRRGFTPERGSVVDFGCGTAVASRAWVDRFGADSIDRLHLVDASELAVTFAREIVAERWPALRIDTKLPNKAPDVLLVSHVASELAEPEFVELLALARTAQWVVWVEPGSREISRALTKARDGLLDALEPVAPCTHANACPMNTVEREKDWCHFFATPPNEVFIESEWARFGKRLGIDLRSLPYAFLAMRKASNAVSSPATGASERVLGRARLLKGRANFDACGPEGLRNLRLLERDDKPLVRRLAEPGDGHTYRFTAENGRVMTVEVAT